MRFPAVGVAAFAAVGSALIPISARADFTGQTILGPLTPGLSIAGDLTGTSDDNDGFFSGTHIFDIWDGGDDVYSLVWPGGDMTVDLISDPFGDADLFIYRPSDLDESGDYSAAGTFDTVSIPGAVAGTYYVVIDTTAGNESPYEVSVANIPSPGPAAILAVAAGLGTRRRRR
ncbi:MAG: hypothetical protein IT436_08645 [Phycisphaerales bacterium]|nr:hypothetical protein [Phycisphaerales bacterium]